jgi:hypothetical protein
MIRRVEGATVDQVAAEVEQLVRAGGTPLVTSAEGAGYVVMVSMPDHHAALAPVVALPAARIPDPDPPEGLVRAQSGAGWLPAGSPAPERYRARWWTTPGGEFSGEVTGGPGLAAVAVSKEALLERLQSLASKRARPTAIVLNETQGYDAPLAPFEVQLVVHADRHGRWWSWCPQVAVLAVDQMTSRGAAVEAMQKRIAEASRGRYVGVLLDEAEAA